MAYTTIDDPSAHFQTKIYSGQNSVQSVTNDGNSNLKPDWLWIKSRNGSDIHHITDSTRGTDLYLRSNDNSAETSSTGHTESFDTDGFSLAGVNDVVNTGGGLYVAWQWKANGGTRTTFSESGDNPAGGYQANTTAGFSIVDYTGTEATGTLAHGLGAIPKLIIVKDRDATRSWSVYHHKMGSPAIEKNMHLNTAAAVTDYNAEYWSGTDPTTSVFGLGNAHDVNKDGEKFIAYVFAEKQGYSKFGSYTGNGNANGPFVYLGFKPAFVMMKETNGAGSSWAIFDNKRSDATGANVIDKELAANEISSEYDRTAANTDFLSNGFKIRNTDGWHNTSGDTYIYMAFAESPFVTSTGIPTTAR
jgi:hypothetical protein